MSRRLDAATLALAFVGGACLMALPAHASNMGFKIPRSFAVVRRDPPDPPFQNIYLVSFPLHNGLGDIASTGAAGNKCDAGPDLIVDSTDAICDLFTERFFPQDAGNSFAINRINRDTCVLETQTATVSGLLGGLTFGGTAFLLERDAGVWITVGASKTPPPLNRAVLVGSDDPSHAGREIRVPMPDCAGPRQDLVYFPYHSMYRKVDEILCGLEGVDWVDADGNGNPDTCTRGIFDGQHAISVLTFDNVKDDSTVTKDDAFTSRSVTRIPLTGQLGLAGSNYDLILGDAYVVSISQQHGTTTFRSPTF